MNMRFHSPIYPISILVLSVFVLSVYVFSEKTLREPDTYTQQELFRLGTQREFKGSNLNEIAFPLGGIGTGMVSLGGRGNLRDWEIFNRPGKGINLPYTFFALHFQQEGCDPVVRVLEGPFPPPFREDFGHGIRRIALAGLPRMRQAVFKGVYPLAQVRLTDKELPLSVVLEAFNPLIPLNPEESGIPGFIIRFRVKNLSPEPARVSIVGSIMNPIGFDGLKDLQSFHSKEFGQNVNELRRTDQLSGLYMSSKKVPSQSPVFGTMVMATPWQEITYLTHWKRTDWADERLFWQDFVDDGMLQNVDDSSPSQEGRTDVGSLGAIATLGAFDEVVLPYIISWNFPNLTNYMDDKAYIRLNEEKGRIYRTHYSKRFKNAWESAEYLVENLPELETQTMRFIKNFFSQTIPPYVLEAVSSQASIIRTPTCFWLDDGSFFGYEGCDDSVGCCPLNCTHVWNYAQALAFLFPSLERSMRETDYMYNVKPDGEMVFRTTLPRGEGRHWDRGPAADGQMGRIISLYRDWQISGDYDFLEKVWPRAKKALEYAWVLWDKDRDGIIEGEQHNTYDVEFYGPNSMISSIYLGALLAGSKMAEALKDQKSAREYKYIFEKGIRRFDELLWNGEFYVQKSDEVLKKNYQYGQGCLSDQVLGQWMAEVAGLKRFLPEEHLKKALESVYSYNFLTDFHNHSNLRRVYALADERGLLVCTWPKGGRPPVPFWYADEVWTGIEYQVASHLIYENLVEKGLSIVRAVRDRHDGRKRNPWNEEECGNHYARAMASWSVLLALSGYQYSGIEMHLGFDPKIHQGDFRCFWSTGSAWGRFSQKVTGLNRENIMLQVEEGELKLKRLTFHLPPGLEAKKVVSIRFTSGEKSKEIDYTQDSGTIRLDWKTSFILKKRQNLVIEIYFEK